MFADPQTITINSVAYSLVKVNQDGYSSNYLLRSSTDQYAFRIENKTYTDKKRGVLIDRHTIELVQTIFPVAPSTLSTIRKTYTVIENQQGDSLAGPTLMSGGLFAWLTASNLANITKLLNFES